MTDRHEERVRRNVREEMLREIRGRYSDKRTLGYQLVDECLTLARKSIDEERADYNGQIDAVRQTHEREVERLAKRADSAVQSLEAARATVTALQAKLSNVRESQAAVDGGVEVTFAAPTSERGHPRDWTLGELEQVIYRLRVAGADDLTKINVSHKTTSAVVPFPEMVGLERPTPPPRPEPLPNPVSKPADIPWPWESRVGQAMIGVIAAIFMMIVLVGVLR